MLSNNGKSDRNLCLRETETHNPELGLEPDISRHLSCVRITKQVDGYSCALKQHLENAKNYFFSMAIQLFHF